MSLIQAKRWESERPASSRTICKRNKSMKTAIAALFACSALCQTIAAAEMQVQRELRYAAGQDEKQALDV